MFLEHRASHGLLKVHKELYMRRLLHLSFFELTDGVGGSKYMMYLVKILPTIYLWIIQS